MYIFFSEMCSSPDEVVVMKFFDRLRNISISLFYV